MANCKDCKHYPMCGFSKYTKTPEKCLDFWDVSDVVKVVRCKDCRFKTEPGQPNILCYHMKDNDFCSYGERRKERQ